MRSVQLELNSARLICQWFGSSGRLTYACAEPNYSSASSVPPIYSGGREALHQLNAEVPQSVFDLRPQGIGARIADAVGAAPIMGLSCRQLVLRFYAGDMAGLYTNPVGLPNELRNLFVGWHGKVCLGSASLPDCTVSQGRRESDGPNRSSR